MKYLILFTPFVGIFSPHLVEDFESINHNVLRAALIYQLFVIGLIFML